MKFEKDKNLKTKINWNSPSIKTLLLANVITIIWAVVSRWDVATIVWIYWFQSVVIGIFQAKKMLDLKTFLTEGLKINNQPVSPTDKSKKNVVSFFVLHYGFFHFVYFIFLAQVSKDVIWIAVVYSGAIFFFNHLYSYLSNKNVDRNKVKNIGQMMFYPYYRIFPIHFIILFGLFAINHPITLIIFMSMKTVADVYMHAKEHSYDKKTEITT